MPVATMSLIATANDATGGTLAFLTAVAPTGFPLTLFSHQEEELTTPGVDGRRWRTVFDQAAPFTLDTIQDCATYSAAMTLAETYHRTRGRLITLTATIGGTTRTFSRLHILDVTVRATPARTVGSGVLAGATAAVVATWTLVGT